MRSRSAELTHTAPGGGVIFAKVSTNQFTTVTAEQQPRQLIQLTLATLAPPGVLLLNYSAFAFNFFNHLKPYLFVCVFFLILNFPS